MQASHISNVETEGKEKGLLITLFDTNPFYFPRIAIDIMKCYPADSEIKWIDYADKECKSIFRKLRKNEDSK